MLRSVRTDFTATVCSGSMCDQVIVNKSKPSFGRRPKLKFTSFDLFSGAGGVSIGLEAAGFYSLGSIEIDEMAAATYKKNFRSRPVFWHGPQEGDIQNVSLPLLRNDLLRAGVDNLDLLVAAPPCQGFSRVGRGRLDKAAGRKGSFLNDPRNRLFEYAITTISLLRPKFVLFENVAGILHLGGTNVALEVCRAIHKAGYLVRCALLNTAWYGVPQVRERVVIIATRADLKIQPQFPPRRYAVELTRGRFTGAELDPASWEGTSYFIPPEQIASVPASALMKAVSVRDALGDLPPFTKHLEAIEKGTTYRTLRELFPPVPYRVGRPSAYATTMRNWSHFDPNSTLVSDHFCRWTPRDFETFRLMKVGDRYPEAVAIAEERFHRAMERWRRQGGQEPGRDDYVPPYKLDGFSDKWRKLIPDLPAWTVTAHLSKDTYSHIHYDDDQARAVTVREAARLQSFPDNFVFKGNMGDAFRQIGNAVPPLLALALGKVIYKQLKTLYNSNTKGIMWTSPRILGVKLPLSQQLVS